MSDRLSLAARIAQDLRQALASGALRPGDKLPSEATLTRQHGVSRTVVREAIAALRSDGLVVARKGAGVFAVTPEARPFDDIATARIASVIELLELRSAVEVEAARLAALRRGPAQVEALLAAHAALLACLAEGRPTEEADFAFHRAIAEATQNRRFPEFLQLIRAGILPRVALQGQTPRDFNRDLAEEHQAILSAILSAAPEEAAQAMRRHLQGSLARYQALLG